MKKLKQTEMTPDMVLLLNGYRTRLTDITAIAAYQQGAVISHLEKLIEEGAKGE